MRGVRETLAIGPDPGGTGIVGKIQRREACFWVEVLGFWTERTELIEHIAGLPSALVDDDISAKQFDYLILQTQLAVLRAEKAFAGYKKRIVDLASALEELGNVPMVAAEMAFILEIQTDEFWQDVTPPMLEAIRRRLRSLIKLIELKKRPHVYTDFE